MKNFSKFVLFGLLAFIFSACSFFGDKEIVKLTFTEQQGFTMVTSEEEEATKDESEIEEIKQEKVYPDSYSYVEILDLAPNYEERTLDVEYREVYPFSVPEKEDNIIEGMVGGEFFDRFELIIEEYIDGDILELSNSMDYCFEESTFFLGVEEYSGKPGGYDRIDLTHCGEPEGEMLIEIEAFYKDVVNLLTEDIRI